MARPRQRPGLRSMRPGAGNPKCFGGSHSGGGPQKTPFHDNEGGGQLCCACLTLRLIQRALRGEKRLFLWQAWRAARPGQSARRASRRPVRTVSSGLQVSPVTHWQCCPQCAWTSQLERLETWYWPRASSCVGTRMRHECNTDARCGLHLATGRLGPGRRTLPQHKPRQAGRPWQQGSPGCAVRNWASGPSSDGGSPCFAAARPQLAPAMPCSDLHLSCPRDIMSSPLRIRLS